MSIELYEERCNTYYVKLGEFASLGSRTIGGEITAIMMAAMAAELYYHGCKDKEAVLKFMNNEMKSALDALCE